MNPNKSLFIALPMLLLANNPAIAESNAINLGIGMHGIAIDYQRAFTPYLGARFMLSDMPLSSEMTEEDIEYEIDYERTNLGVLLDYRPMAGTFHLTFGLYGNEHNLNMEAKSSNANFDIGDSTYTSSNLQLDATAEYAKTTPYLGLGWGGNPQKNGFATNIDIGFLYIGKPDVSLKAQGTVNDGVNNIPVSDPAFQSDLQMEQANLEKDLEDLDLMPIIQFSMGWRF